ncbi:MAG: hypothetical protein RLZZ324_741 [Candidatus Parcubacteria bacterium]|jgi:hypothetical protein
MKKILLAVVVLAMMGTAFFALSQKNAPSPSGSVVNVPANSNANAPTNAPEQEVIDADGWKTHTNKRCGISYRIPAAWTSEGWLSDGPVLLVSPAALQASKDYVKDYPGYVPQGEGGPDMPKVSLSIDCQPDLKTLIANQPWPPLGDVAKMTALPDIFASKPFHEIGSQFKLEKTLTVGGYTAFEISQTLRRSGMADSVTYTLYMEKGKEYVISLGATEYAAISPTLQQIIGNVTFPN